MSQLICGEAWQIWMWFNCSNLHFRNSPHHPHPTRPPPSPTPPPKAIGNTYNESLNWFYLWREYFQFIVKATTLTYSPWWLSFVMEIDKCWYMVFRNWKTYLRIRSATEYILDLKNNNISVFMMTSWQNRFTHNWSICEGNHRSTVLRCGFSSEKYSILELWCFLRGWTE